MLRAALRLAYRGQRTLWRIVRPRTRGVKVLVFNEQDHLLLVRNTYGATHHYALPGGGVRPWEQPHAAAIREVREEVSLSLSNLAFVGSYVSSAEGKRDTVHLFKARTSENPKPDNLEIAEAAFFALSDLPNALSPATSRRIAEYQGLKQVAAEW